MTEITEEMWGIVEARIEEMPPNIKMSIGNASYSKADLLKSVKARNEVGELVAMMEIKYLRAFKNL